MSEELKALYFRIIGLSDEELSQMVNVEYEQYRPEALKFAREEMQRRGLPVKDAKPGGEETPAEEDESGSPEDESEPEEFEEVGPGVFRQTSDKVLTPEVRFEVFRSTMSTWEDLFSEAARFASEIGPLDLINISHSEDNHDGVVTVWYWYR